jgi:hypothetical protein
VLRRYVPGALLSDLSAARSIIGHARGATQRVRNVRNFGGFRTSALAAAVGFVMGRHPKASTGTDVMALRKNAAPSWAVFSQIEHACSGQLRHRPRYLSNLRIMGERNGLWNNGGRLRIKGGEIGARITGGGVGRRTISTQLSPRRI